MKVWNIWSEKNTNFIWLKIELALKETERIFDKAGILPKYQKKLKNTSRSVHKKRNEVVKGLAQKFEMRITLPGKRGRKNRTMTEDQENFLLNLFERSGMTYTNPGSKGNVYLGKTNGKKNINTEKLLPLEAQRRLKYH